MILFDIKLPINATAEQVHSLCSKWVRANRRHRIRIPEYTGEDGEFTGTPGSKLILKHFCVDGKKTLSYRLRQMKTSGEEWIVDVHYCADENPMYVQIQLSYNRNDGKKAPSPQPPNILKLFCSSGLVVSDYGLPVSGQALPVEDYPELCAQVISGKAITMLPIVYISCDAWGNTFVDANALAAKLEGIAHILVETTDNIGQKMKHLSNGRNAHHGYVGVYFSDPYSYEFLAPSDGKVTYEEIERLLRQFFLNRSVTHWDRLYLRQLRRESQNAGELDELLNSVEQDLLCMDALRAENRELLSRLNELSLDNESLKQRLMQKNSNKLFYHPGTEPELYEGERNDLIFYALQSARKTCVDNSRKAILIDSLMTANPEFGVCKDTMEKLSRIFGSGDNLNEHSISELRNLGFDKKSDNSHYKFIFRGDNRWAFTVPKTGSDYRGTKNMIATIKKMLSIE